MRHITKGDEEEIKTNEEMKNEGKRRCVWGAKKQQSRVVKQIRIYVIRTQYKTGSERVSKRGECVDVKKDGDVLGKKRG